MGRARLGRTVLDESMDRLRSVMGAGNRIVVACSGGKDSTVCVELSAMVAEELGYGPIDVVVQEEEVNFPGTYEYLERLAQRPDINMHWLVMQQPMINIFNREQPYFWVMDPLLSPDDWVRKPPAFAEFVREKDINQMVVPRRFPVEVGPAQGAANVSWTQAPPGQKLVKVLGLRASESVNRLFGIHSSGGYMTGGDKLGVFSCRPIYDWSDADVWRFMSEFKLDYNKAYDTMRVMGVATKNLRLAPPTMNGAGVAHLNLSARAWPKWFDRVCTRLPGVRTAAQFGVRVVSPQRRLGETWEQCFYRECVEEAPEWIRDRSLQVVDYVQKRHGRHATTPLPETKGCRCLANLGSWEMLARVMWSGDPYSVRTGGILPYVEPEFFRPGAGTWGEAGDAPAKISW